MTGSRGAAVAAALATAAGPLPARGAAATASVLDEPAGVAWEDGILTYVGPAGGLPWPAAIGSADRGLLVPGFVDCHVHLPFVGWRADEYEARLAGASYRDLHGEGGIFRSSRLLAAASDDDVLAFCLPLVREMASHGTTAMELKTGYGLSVEAELRQARLARALADAAPQTCSVTLLACHAVPNGLSRADWVRTACDELIPAVAADGLADQVDIYVEDIAFSLDDLSAVASAAATAGLPLRVHADQLGPSRAAEAAVALGARSADHLNHLSPAGVAALGGADATVAVLLPASSFLLRAHGAAGRRAPGGRRRARGRDRLQPGDVPRVVDAGGDRVRLLLVRAHAARGAHGGDRQPGVRAGVRRPAGHARDRQARRRPAAGRGPVRAGAVPARPRPRGRDDRRRGAARMIVWLNGPFGVGKTSVARALLEAKPDWSLLDPEVRGEELVRQWPGVDDFQDLPEWRKAVVEDAVERAGTGDLVIPMTIWRLEYYREIMDGLKGATEVRPFRLTAREATLIERIERDLIEPGAVRWRMDRLEEGIQAFQDTAFGDHVGTDGRTPEKIAHLILVTLGRA